MNDYFSLYSYCIPVIGKEQAVICDLQRAGYTEIPQFLFEIFNDFADKPIGDLESLYNDQKKAIKKYLNVLSDRNLGRFSDHPLEFKQMSLEWKRPEPLVSCVIDVGSKSSFDIFQILDQIDQLQCKYLELRYFFNVKQSAIEELLKYTSCSQLRTIDIILPYPANNIDFNIYTYKKNALKYKKLCNSIFYDTSKMISWKNECIFTTPQKLYSPKAFGKIDRDKYIINSPFFSESQSHNPFFNRKVCIDQSGFIKNENSHDESFGHITTDKIADVLKRKDFQRLWFANNDKILGIQDSALRYIWMNTYQLEQVDDELYKMKYDN